MFPGRGRHVVGFLIQEKPVSDLSATIRLRPTRIALLVRPVNLPAIRTFMRICTCLWGGVYNPIIPIFRPQPKDWRTELPELMTGAEIARGYVEFFEPDAFVILVARLHGVAEYHRLRIRPPIIVRLLLRARLTLAVQAERQLRRPGDLHRPVERDADLDTRASTGSCGGFKPPSTTTPGTPGRPGCAGSRLT